MRQTIADIIWLVDDLLFAFEKRFFRKRLDEKIRKNPDHVGFLTLLGFKVLKWM